MKVKHIILWHLIITIGLVSFFLVGCRNNYDEWQTFSSKLYNTSPKTEVCRHRVARIAKQMMVFGKSFDLVFGEAPWSKKEGHIRIEYWRDGELIILDPTWKTRDLSKFRETDRWEYIPMRSDNIRVVSFVNRVLNEIGVEPYTPKK